MIHKISYWWYTDLRSGGPSGYLANLHHGLLNLPEEAKVGPDVWLDSLGPLRSGTAELEITSERMEGHTKWFGNIEDIQLTNEQLDRALSGNAKSLHCHTITDCLMTVQSLALREVDVPVFLSCHSPEAFSKEFSDLWRDQGFDCERVSALRTAVEAVELRAFEKADIWIFPCSEALDGYHETLPGFTALSRNKDIRFVRSGLVDPNTRKPPSDIRQILGIQTSRIALYIGRHNNTKGYDILCEAGIRFLEQNGDVTVLVAGREGPLPCPTHPRWIELGWHSNPSELMQIADFFILPNRTTYYDLVLLEALSHGLPVVASATGGNKEVASLAGGSIVLFENGNIDNCLGVMNAVITDSRRMADMRQMARATYDTYFTASTFAANYRILINEIWKDYNIHA